MEAQLYIDVGERLVRELTTVPLPRLLTRAEQFAFVGRATERADLDAAWQAASKGERHVVLLAGEPGAGKTRLASEFARAVHHDGALVLGGRCDEGMGVPYQPFVEALRWHADHTADVDLAEALGRWPGELIRLVPEIADRISGATPTVSSDPETERYRLFEAITSWLAASPLVLVIDDLQWATGTTLLLLRHVVRTSEGARLLLVGTYRDTEVDEALAKLLADFGREQGVELLTLGGLTESDVAALAADEAEAAAVCAAADGNPFFVGELLRHRAESSDGDIPATIQNVVGDRIRRLPEVAQSVLTTAAIIGEDFEIAVVEAAGDIAHADLLDALDFASKAPACLLRTDSDTASRTRWSARRLSHHWVRHAVRMRTSGWPPPSRRCTRMLSTNTCLLSRAISRRPAYLARRPTTRFAAGEVALGQHANDDATRLFTTALELVGTAGTTQRCDVLISLGEALRRTGQAGYREMASEASDLAEQLGDGERMARAALVTSEGWTDLAVDEHGVALLERALSLLDLAPSALRARATAALALKLAESGTDYDRRVQLSDEALAMARTVGDLTALADVLAARNNTIWAPDNLAERLRNLHELTAVADELQDPHVSALTHWVGCFTYLQAGDGDAVDASVAALERLTADAEPRSRWLAFTQRSMRALGTGQITAADEFAEAALAAGQAGAVPQAVEVYEALIYGVRLFQGRIGETLEHGTGRSAGLRRAYAYAELGDINAARDVFDASAAAAFADTPRGRPWLNAITAWAGVAAVLEDVPNANSLIDMLQPFADQVVISGVLDRGPVALYLGLLAGVAAEWDDGEVWFSEARDTCDRLRSIWGPRVRYGWARLLAKRGLTADRSRALQLANEGLELARAMDVPVDIAGGDRLLAELTASARE